MPGDDPPEVAEVEFVAPPLLPAEPTAATDLSPAATEAEPVLVPDALEPAADKPATVDADKTRAVVLDAEVEGHVHWHVPTSADSMSHLLWTLSPCWRCQ